MDKKTFYNKKSEFVRKNKVKRTYGRIELNPEALSTVELMEECGLYVYKPHKETKKNGKPAKNTGKLIFNDKTGTCTHELIELSDEEIAAREEQELRMRFEKEQFEKEEQEKEEKFKAWKAEKKAKSK